MLQNRSAAVLGRSNLSPQACLVNSVKYDRARIIGACCARGRAHSDVVHLTDWAVGLSVCVLLLSSLNLIGAFGGVRTTNGEHLAGEIQFETNAIVIAASNQAPTRVELGRISVLQVQPGSSSEASSPIPEPTGRILPKPKLPAGIVLTGGSIIARRVSSADDTAIRFLDSKSEIALSTVNVARILFQPLAYELEERLQTGRTGVLLSSKEFIEGEFKGFAEGQIKLSSVLFGPKAYDPGQVIAVILRDLKPAAAGYEVKTRDDSCLLVNHLQITKDTIQLQDPALAGMKIATTDVTELTRLPKR